MFRYKLNTIIYTIYIEFLFMCKYWPRYDVHYAEKRFQHRIQERYWYGNTYTSLPSSFKHSQQNNIDYEYSIGFYSLCWFFQWTKTTTKKKVHALLIFSQSLTSKYLKFLSIFHNGCEICDWLVSSLVFFIKHCIITQNELAIFGLWNSFKNLAWDFSWDLSINIAELLVGNY